MLRTLALAALLAALPRTSAAQAPSELLITIGVDVDGIATPVARHALLISDIPPSATPRRVVTGPDGTAKVRLRPGTYSVESDQPFVRQDRAYQWFQTVEVVATGTTTLALTAGNAEIQTAATTAAAPATTSTSATSPSTTTAAGTDAWLAVAGWRDSVVEIWSPTGHASGFLVGPNGLVATRHRVIGAATSVAVQLTPAIKVAANVVATDPTMDVAIVRIDPQRASLLKAVPLGCADAATPSVTADDRIFAIGAPMRRPKETAPGSVTAVNTQTYATDLILTANAAGGPVFTATGTLIGLTSMAGDDDGSRETVGVVGTRTVCELVALAERQIEGNAPASGPLLPVEPTAAIPTAVLDEAVKQRAGNLRPYQMTASEFDLAFITPVHVYAEFNPSTMGAMPGRPARAANPGQPAAPPVMEFGRWSAYVRDALSVLLVRVTPRQVEGFWAKAARAAARTQGVALPTLARFGSSFHHLRAFCGEAEVAPIHPFTLEHRVSETEAIDEGLYVFDPAALGPSCSSVKLLLYSVKAPERSDTQVVDAKILQQIWQDFALR